MKNNRIARAYDSINPSPADKQRMLDAILAEAKLEDKPETPKKRKEPIVYTAKPTKTSRRGLIGALAACFAVFLIGGFALLRLFGEPVNPAYEEPTTEATEESTTGVYDEVLAKYSRALNEKWPEERCEMEGISIKFPAIYYAEADAGYQILDLNEDGREELVISDGSAVWDLYTTLEDGTPVQLHTDENDGVLCQLYDGGIIGIELTTKTDAEYDYYRLENNRLVAEEMIQYTDANEQWSRENGGQEWEIISREEASDILYGYEPMELALHYFRPSSVDVAARELYMLTLEKYKTASAEGWDRIMCVENGMSMLTPIESEYEGLYYAISDLDGNGVQELVISEYPYREDTDTNFIDIYTVLDGNVIQVMSLGDTDMRYLCEGGYVKDLTPPDLGEYSAFVSYWQLQEDQFVQTGHVYNIDGQWYHGFRANEKITAEDADAEVKSYKPAKLDFIPIGEDSEPQSLTGYEDFDYIVNKYVTAINEGWTEYQCEQNDISPQILSDTAIQSNLGWCLLDIDGNGIEELVVSDGVHLFDLYVMMPHNGGPGHLVMANNGETYQLCENGVIRMQGYYSGTSAWRYYTLVEIDLVQRDMVFYEGAANQYSYGADDDSLKPISKDEAGDIIARDRTAELILTRFVDPAPFEPNEMEYYNPLLDIYRKAIREHWNPGVCVENGISLMVGYYGDFVDELGYTTMDLDNNGIQELIVTDGTNIYDLYTIVQDEEPGPLRLVDAMERIEYFLTEDNLIYCRGSGGAARTYHTLYYLLEDHLGYMDGYAYDADRDPDNPWFHYDGENVGTSVGHSNPQALIDSRKPLHIPFTPFVETVSGEVPVN